MAGQLVLLGRLVGLALIDVEIALTRRHTGPRALLVVLAVLEAVATFALAVVALEVGVLWANLGPSAALGYPAILLGSAVIGLTRRQYVAQSRAAEALVAQPPPRRMCRSGPSCPTS